MKKVIMLLFLSLNVLSIAVAENLQLFEAGKKAFSVGLYSIALENFEQYLSDSKIDKRVDALYLSGITAYYLKNYKDSITYLWAIEQEFPDSGYINPSYYWIGLNYYYLADYENATQFFSKNMAIESNFRDISRLYNALSNIQLNRIDKAKSSFLEIINDPKAQNRYIEEALYRLSTLYIEDKEYNSAINMLNKIIFDYSDSKYYKDSLSLISDSYYILKEWSSALRSYELLKEFVSDDKKIYKRLATIFFNLGNNRGAKENLIYYNDNYGLDRDVLFMLGDIYVKEGNNNEALIIYEKINKLDLTEKESIENHLRLGKLYYKINEFNNAYNNFMKVNTKESIYLAYLSGLKANKDVLSLIKILNNKYYGDDYSYDSINRYINTLENKGSISELESFLNYTTTLYPKNINYSLTYGELLLEQNRLDESLKYLSVGYDKKSVFYSNLSYKIGWIYYNKKEFTRAIEYFDRLKVGDEDYIKAIYSKSIAYYKIGNLNKGKEGFLLLLQQDSDYTEQVSYYLGLIEKDHYNYEKALKYFTTSKEDEDLYDDSISNIAWCYYHLKLYPLALEIYIQTNNKFNAANCYLFMEEYEDALKLYIEVTKSESDLKSSAYYKSVEILFKLGRNDDAYNMVKTFYNEYPQSDLPGEVILTNGDNLLYSGNVQEALVTFNKIMELFPNKKEWVKARYRLSECYYLLDKYEESINSYLSSVIDWDIYHEESINHIVNILSELSNPTLTESVKRRVDRDIKEKNKVIPIYIEYVKQGINRDDILEEINDLISISNSRNEINSLIYLKSLYYYTISNIELSQETLKILLERPEINDVVKIDAIMLQAKIMVDKGESDKATDLYLKLYINFSDRIDESSKALYYGLLLTRDSGDSEMEDKIYNILKNEYSETLWGRRGLNAE